MEQNNVISTVYLIEQDNGFLEPVIYLERPESIEGVKILMFANPFEAKNYVRLVWGQFVEITVQRAA